MGRRCCAPDETRDHFKGKNAYEHLKDARLKTQAKLSESHGLYSNVPLLVAFDVAKETILIFSLLFIMAEKLPMLQMMHYMTFILGWVIWKTVRGSFLAWGRLAKLHRVIEEEKYEITHNRKQEKKELEEMYRLKGFEGELLNQVVDVLMADDNRLLHVMLEEELGLELGTFEHPLKFALANFLGVCSPALILIIALYLVPYGVWIFSPLCVVIIAFIQSKIEQLEPIKTIVWNTACLLLATGCALFFMHFLEF